MSEALPPGAVGKCPNGKLVYARKGESKEAAMRRVCK